MVADSVSTILASIRFYADETNIGEPHTVLSGAFAPAAWCGVSCLGVFLMFFAQARVCCGGDCLFAISRPSGWILHVKLLEHLFHPVSDIDIEMELLNLFLKRHA
jgi:hypothetical protein